MTRVIIAILLTMFSLTISANSSIKTSKDQASVISNVNIEHSGRTDKDGCHMDRKTGTRHCH